MDKDAFVAQAQKIYGKSGWQKQLAEALSLSPVTISRYATGRLRVPPVVGVAMNALERGS